MQEARASKARKHESRNHGGVCMFCTGGVKVLRRRGDGVWRPGGSESRSLGGFEAVRRRYTEAMRLGYREVWRRGGANAQTIKCVDGLKRESAQARRREGSAVLMHGPREVCGN